MKTTGMKSRRDSINSDRRAPQIPVLRSGPINPSGQHDGGAIAGAPPSAPVARWERQCPSAGPGFGFGLAHLRILASDRHGASPPPDLTMFGEKLCPRLPCHATSCLPLQIIKMIKAIKYLVTKSVIGHSDTCSSFTVYRTMDYINQGFFWGKLSIMSTVLLLV